MAKAGERAIFGLLVFAFIAGLGLLAYGAWLAWHPLGPMVVGAGLLADAAWSRRDRGVSP